MRSYSPAPPAHQRIRATTWPATRRTTSTSTTRPSSVRRSRTSCTDSPTRRSAGSCLTLGGAGEDRGCLVDLLGGANARFERALDPRVVERGVLAGKVNASLRRHDRVLEARLLFRLEQRERAPCVGIAIPILDGAALELA